ncbi:hypothetical protein MVEN_01741300 [Mycena venus]|uniref:DUF6534 domain-containing protein n=1 Tax=Mycena venus TaxID=2733690 RepID=A0A8H6XM25_9AGAR|nr:hypothetical protein MVEN_01741300 [Mycena venus]
MSSIPSDIAIITGPTMVGICLNWGFMGVLLVQLYYYNENFHDDRRLIKLLVYGLALLDILQTIMVTADAFHWFVYGFGSMAQLDQTFLNSWDVPVLDAIILPRCTSLLLLAYLFPTQDIHYSRAHPPRLPDTVTEVVPQTIWLAGGALADVAIAGVLSWTLLYKQNTAARSSLTHSVVGRIIRLVVETNALTASVAVLALILFWGVKQHPTLVVPPTAIIGKLYTNCLIALFNNRAKETKSQSAHGMHSERSQAHSRHNQNNSVKVHVVREMDMSFEGQMELVNLQV